MNEETIDALMTNYRAAAALRDAAVAAWRANPNAANRLAKNEAQDGCNAAVLSVIAAANEFGISVRFSDWPAGA